MSPLDVLLIMGLGCWSTILLGFKRGWIKRKDVFDFAMDQLLMDCENEQVAIIAGAEYFSDEELLQSVSTQMESMDYAVEMDKWRLAFLVCTDVSNRSEVDKLNELQEIYSEFNYPEDMASCSIYSQDDVEPLVAMSQVIEKLRARFYRCYL